VCCITRSGFHLVFLDLVTNRFTFWSQMSQMVLFTAWNPDWKRGTGLTIRDCTESCNSFSKIRTTTNAHNVTAKAIFEHLYLISGQCTFARSINCRCASTPSTAHSVTNSRFFCLVTYHFFDQHDSPSNLAESRYPRSERLSVRPRELFMFS